MNTKTKAASFAAKEQECEYLFSTKGPFWHLYTDGNCSQILFCSEDDFKFGMNLMGICSGCFPEVRIYTFTLMNNHLHIILEGDKEEAENLFRMFRARLQRFFCVNGRSVDLSRFECSFTEISTLQSLRNEIAYTNRNGYVVHRGCTPFSYLWGAGATFFNPLIKHIPSVGFSVLSVKVRRSICHSHNLDFDSARLRVYQGVILPSSFCHIRDAEGMFRDAHNYFYLISKNFETYSEIAKRLHESVFISDDEMYAAMSGVAARKFNTRQPSLLSSKEKIEMAKIMHAEYNASNRQIKSILKLDGGLVDELFPLRSQSAD